MKIIKNFLLKLKNKKVAVFFSALFGLGATALVLMPTIVVSTQEGASSNVSHASNLKLEEQKSSAQSSPSSLTATPRAVAPRSLQQINVDSSITGQHLAFDGLLSSIKNSNRWTTTHDDAINANKPLNISDPSLVVDHAEIRYSIDLANGTLLANQTGPSNIGIFLNKQDFGSYMYWALKIRTVSGSYQIYDSAHNDAVITYLDANNIVSARIASHLLKVDQATGRIADGTRLKPQIIGLPLQKMHNDHYVFAAWFAKDPQNYSINDLAAPHAVGITVTSVDTSTVVKDIYMYHTDADDFKTMQIVGSTQSSANWALKYAPDHPQDSFHDCWEGFDITDTTGLLEDCGIFLDYSYAADEANALWQTDRPGWNPNETAVGTHDIWDLIRSRNLYLKIVSNGDPLVQVIYEVTNSSYPGYVSLDTTSTNPTTHAKNLVTYFDGPELNTAIATGVVSGTTGETAAASSWSVAFHATDPKYATFPFNDSTKLTALGVKIQYTYALGSSAIWQDAKLDFHTDKALNGQTIQQLFSDTSRNISLRIVPLSTAETYVSVANATLSTNDGLGVRMVYHLGASPGAALKTLEKDPTTHAFLFVVPVYRIPTDSTLFAQIRLSGASNLATFTNLDTIIAQTRALSATTSQTNAPFDHLVLRFAIDRQDGSFISTVSASNEIFLKQEDFLAYIKGELIVFNNKVVYASDHTKQVDAFDLADINARLTAKVLMANVDGTAFAPDFLYFPVATNFVVKAKWTTPDITKFIPLEVDHNDHTTITTTPAMTATIDASGLLKHVIISGQLIDKIATFKLSGTTQDATSWSVAYSTVSADNQASFGYWQRLNILDATQMQSLGLKLQYAYVANGVWQDSKLNFKNDAAVGSSAIWDLILARLVFIRIVPYTFTGTAPITGVSQILSGNKISLNYADANKLSARLSDSPTTGPKSFLVYYDGAELNAMIAAAVVSGSTQSATTWTIDYSAYTDAFWRLINLNGADLSTKYGLKIQYSYSQDASALWQDAKLNFENDRSLNRRNILNVFSATARDIFIRVVSTATPESFNGMTGGTLTNNSGIGINIAYGTNQVGAQLKTLEKNANGVSKFRIFLRTNNIELNSIYLYGNTYKIDSIGYYHALTNNNIGTYAEVIFLYRGKWYIGDDVIKAINDYATAHPLESDAAAGTWQAPTDFRPLSHAMRYKLKDPVNYTIASESTIAAVSTSASTAWVVSSQYNSAGHAGVEFKEFVDISHIQTTDNHFSPFLVNTSDANLHGQDAMVSLTGTLGDVALKLLIDQIRGLGAGYLVTNGFKVQYSTIANPGSAPASTDWHDSMSGLAVLENLALDPINKYLWLRFVSTSNGKVLSTYENFGIIQTGQTASIMKIAVDVSRLKFLIETNLQSLANMHVSGWTQFVGGANGNSGLVADITPFTVAHLITSGQYGLSGIREIYTIDNSGNKVDVTTEQEINNWVNTVGITVRFRVTSSRTASATYDQTVHRFVKGTDYTFETSDDLIKALRSGALNFDRSTLFVSWGIKTSKAAQYEVSSSSLPNPWIQPQDLTNLINVIYTEDVYTLTSDTLVIIGNNLKLSSVNISTTESDQALGGVTATQTLAPANLQRYGLILQYNVQMDPNNPSVPNPNTWLNSAPLSGLDGLKHYFIRFQASNSDYLISSLRYPNNPTQTTAVGASRVRLAIPFQSHNTLKAITDMLANAEIVGTTYEFNWQGAGTSAARSLPQFALSADNSVHGYIQYSRDGRTWSETIAGALAGSDHYINGLLSFDKDRGDKLYVRYVYEEDHGLSSTPRESNSYVYTDASGNEFGSVSALSRTIEINNLIQPVFIGSTLESLTGLSNIAYPGMLTSTGVINFASVTWIQLVNDPYFRANFIPSTVDSHNASFTNLTYNEQLKDSALEYLFHLARNPFSGALEQRNDFTAFAPRHAHFEYSFRSSGSSAWSAWSTNVAILNNLIKNSNEAHLRVRIVAEQGYELPKSYTTTNQFTLDASPRSSAVSITPLSWEREFNVVTIVRTNDVGLPGTADQASYIGWNVNNAPIGTFRTVQPADGDHNPVSTIGPNRPARDIMIKFINTTLNSAFDPKNSNSILEWRVTDGVNDIEWTDSRGRTATGWHLSGQSTESPDASTIPWYGAYPVSLKNGDVIYVRFRAVDGFVIKGDNNSSDYDPITGESKWSHEMRMLPVSGLLQKITVPNDFRFYDLSHPFDFYGHRFTSGEIDTNLPTVQFSGGEGHGTIAFPGSENLDYTYEVAVLRPANNPNLVPGAAPVALFDTNQSPRFGYVTRDSNGQTLQVYYSSRSGVHTIGWIPNWEKSLVWVAPAAVVDLSVGDVVVMRLKAKTGFGFEWENPDNTFVDIKFPKEVTERPFGTNRLSNKPSYIVNDLNMNSNHGVVPVVIRGLYVLPQFKPSSIPALELSSKPSESLNNHDSVVSIPAAFLPPAGSDWIWNFKIERNGGVIDTNWVTSLPHGLLNGDKVHIIAAPISGSFTLDPNYDNTERVLVVSGLRTPLNGDFIPRPIITVGGYEAEGRIVSFVPYMQTSGSYQPDVNLWQAAQPGLPFGRPLLKIGTEQLRWEYKVTSLDPSIASNAPQIEAIPWTDVPPTNLRVGQYVRVRVAAVNPNQVVLANQGTETIYSIIPGSTTDDGWIKVTGLALRPQNIDISINVSGFINKTVIVATFIRNTPDESRVTIEYSIDGTHWLDGNADDLKTLTNGQTVYMRVVANPGFVFNLSDAVASGPEQSTITVENNKFYLQKNRWRVTITGLKNYLYVGDVEFLPNQITWSAAPDSPVAQPQNPNGIYDGYANIDEISINPATIGTVVDVNGHTSFTNTNGVQVQYSSLLRVRYVVKTIDPITGIPNEDVVYENGNRPTHLSNGDRVVVEMYSISPEFSLSQSKTLLRQVSGLIVGGGQFVSDPSLFFHGRSGEGFVEAGPTAPRRTRWLFSVTRAGTTLPIIDASFINNDANWSATAPSDLRNGDFVIAKLGSVLAGVALGITNTYTDHRPVAIPINMHWVPVIGLVQKIDVSGLVFKLFDPANPYSPSKIIDSNDPTRLVNFAFKLVGNQEGLARLEVNSPLYSAEPSERLVDDSGRQIPTTYSPALVWTFMVNGSESQYDGVYTTDLPTNLRNGEFIHVRLASNSPEFSVEGAQNNKHFVIEIKGLESQPVLTNQAITLIVSIVAGMAVIAGIAGTVIFFRARSRRLGL